jgi:hypothetical protein
MPCLANDAISMYIKDNFFIDLGEGKAGALYRQQNAIFRR